ncbi:hypothetical protein SAMN05216524_102507 [Mucilaginibacter sp. OK098]|nr:hypothetical protein SAMN05216524_102507 [Mucilaginibacter sp. OK098]
MMLQVSIMLQNFKKEKQEVKNQELRQEENIREARSQESGIKRKRECY